ncbi:MAG TPA: SIS domain-containing protein [Candidatus Hydrothermia bacterium]|nr:SIS domain-containing protein [Candidatus Hydrothermia bacterium]HOP32644.1 SIS domain-containing protein [Candidatus Hydrothermia bacterium]
MERLREIIEILETLKEKESEKLRNAANLIAMTLKSGNTIFWCGNGGSAAQAMHFSTELMVKYKSNRRPFQSIALSADPVLLTAAGNDFGFDEIFSRQIEGLGRENDLLVAITTSGSSANILKAIKKAKEYKIKVILITGEKALELDDDVNVAIHVPSHNTPLIQECHEIIGHILVEEAEKLLGGF